MGAIRDCYPCHGSGVTTRSGYRLQCSNCQGSGVSPTWALSDGSDPAKREAAKHGEVLHCFVDARTVELLRAYSATSGRSVEELAEAAISEAAIQTARWAPEPASQP